MILEYKAFAKLHAFVVLVTTVCLFASASPVLQAMEGNVSDIWYRGYMLNKLAEEKDKAGDLLEALNIYNDALPLLKGVAQEYPTFHPEIVKERIRIITERTRTIKIELRENSRPGSGSQSGPKPGETQQLGSGEVDLPTWGNDSGPTEGNNVIPSTPPATPPTTVQNPPVTLPPTYNQPPPVTGGSIVEQLVQQERARENQIAALTQQNAELNRRIAESEKKFSQAQAQLDAARRERQQLEANRGNATNEGEWRRLFEAANTELESQVELNRNLLAQLESSREQISSLQKTLREVERERDMALSGNAASEGLRDMVSQNKDLRERLKQIETFAESTQELNRQKTEEIQVLKTELAEVRGQWQVVKEQNEEYLKNIEKLRNQLMILQNGLTSEEALLLADANPVVAAENDMLKNVVMKQLQRQSQRKRATDLLLAELDSVGARTEALDAIVEDIATGAELSEPEKNLFKAPVMSELVADVENNAIDYQPRTTPKVKIKSAAGSVEEKALSKELAQIQKVAQLDFQEKRYDEAEEGYERYLKYRPNNVPCLCNLALVQITMGKYEDAQSQLEKAISLKEDSGVAYYLLGRTYFVQGLHDDALKSLKTGLSHDPKNAKAHNCVGVISSQKGLVQQAEESFTEAVVIDPEYGDAHFNLAVLFATRDDPNAMKAKEHYFKALHLGIPRDASIETFLKQNAASSVSVGMVQSR